jgi:hypothetical protein
MCGALTAAAYYLVLFSDWGNYFHRSSPLKVVVLDSAVVLGAFACLEVFRTERFTPVRAVAAALGCPLALVALLTLWYGLKRHMSI